MSPKSQVDAGKGSGVILVDQSDDKMDLITSSCIILQETLVGEKEGRPPACSNTSHLYRQSQPERKRERERERERKRPSSLS